MTIHAGEGGELYGQTQVASSLHDPVCCRAMVLLTFTCLYVDIRLYKEQKILQNKMHFFYNYSSCKKKNPSPKSGAVAQWQNICLAHRSSQVQTLEVNSVIYS